MITKEQAIAIVMKYVAERQRNYMDIETEDVSYEDNEEIIYGKYKNEKRPTYTITCTRESLNADPICHFITIDAEAGEVLYTITPHGYAEEWEE